MNANSLVDLLLELNVLNVEDIDIELAKLAARIVEPRGKKWFMKVPRFFIINIERLLKDPQSLRAQQRRTKPVTLPQVTGPHQRNTGRYGSSPHYLEPSGGWAAGQEPPEDKKSPIRVNPAPEKREDTPAEDVYDPKTRTYKTMLHTPVVQKDIEQSFTPFDPSRAKEKRIVGEPMAAHELPAWAKTGDKEFHHFDPIQVRRRELWGRYSNLVNYLNYVAEFLKPHEIAAHKEKTAARDAARAARQAAKKERIAAGLPPHEDHEEDEPAPAAGKHTPEEAEQFFRKLDKMKTDDITGFREILVQSYEFDTNVKQKPWEYVPDNVVVAELKPLTLHEVSFAETAFSLVHGTRFEANPGNPQAEATRFENMLQEGKLYFAFKNEKLYAIIQFGYGGVDQTGHIFVADDLYGRDPSPELARELAPLFADQTRFTPAMLVTIRAIARITNIPDESVTVYAFEDGWRLVRLTTELDLGREGVLMNHCVGTQTYREKLKNHTCEFYSLRDPANTAITTLELQTPRNQPPTGLLQIKGYADITHFPPEISAKLRAVVAHFNWPVLGDHSSLR